MKGFQLVAELLVSRGCRTMFGVLGEGNLLLASTLTDRFGVRFISARHEAGAMAMADGFARVSDGLAFCTVSHGPGFTNAITPLLAASRNGTPVVLIAGALPQKASRHIQYLDQARLLDAVGVSFLELDDEAYPARALAGAVDAALAEGRPLVLNLSMDFQESEREGTEPLQAEPIGSPEPQAPSPQVMTEAAEIIAAADRPVLLAGRGARSAAPVLVDFAARIGAVLASTLPAKGMFAQDPWYIGVSGGLGDEAAQAILQQADCVVAFGASLNHMTTGRGGFFPNARLVHVDLDPAAIGAYLEPTIGLVGDAAETARQLCALLEPAEGWRNQQLVRLLTDREAPPPLGGSAPFDADAVLANVNLLLPLDRCVVVDGGQVMGHACRHLRISSEGRLVLSTDFGALGLGLATSIGAAFARPDTTTMLSVGDGGFLMGIGELETAVRYGLPMVILVLNDEAYGAEVHQLRARGRPDGIARFPGMPALVSVAEGFGATATRLESTEDFVALHDMTRDLSGPLVVEVPITGTLASWFEPFVHG